jgi:hypothetical protein
MGHVTRDIVNGHPAYKIEYWQFFAFNNQDITILGMGSFGDHEGDWTSVQVWFDRELHRLAKIVYLIHGKDVTFDIPDKAPTTRSGFVDVKGAHYDPNVGNFFDEKERAKYDDNQAQFWVDEHGYRHVVVYIERGGHEFWPGAWGYGTPASVAGITFHLDGHNGQSVSYLVPDVMDRPFNVGEVAHPLTANARIVLEYDGHWGCTNTRDLFGHGPLRKSPVGPSIHCEWRWPDRAPVAGCEH